MAENLPDLEAKVRLDDSDLDAAVGRAAKHGAAIGSALGSALGGLAANGIAALGRGLVGAFRGGLDELQGNQTAMAQFEAGLQKSGKTAGVTKDKIQGLADSIEAKTGTDGAAVVSGAALLLTFSKVQDKAGEGANIFTRATEAGVDLAARGFGSVEGNAIQLGKALNDPIAGISALSRSGITFTAEQKKTIKSMVETGNVLGAQKIILGEVENQVKGSAEAYGNTLPGRVARGKAALEGIEESVVKAVLPAMVGIGEAVNTKVLPAMASLASSIGPAISAIGPALAEVAAKVAAFAGMLGDLAAKIPLPVLQGLGVILGTLAAAMAVQTAATAAWSAVTGIASGVAALFATTTNAETGATERGVIARIAHNVATVASAVAHGVAVAATAAWTAAQWLLNAALSANPLGLVIAAIALLVAGLVLAYRNSETFRNIVTAALNAVKAAGQALASFFTTTIPAAFQAVKDKVAGIVAAMGAALSAAWGAIKVAVSTAFGAIKAVFEAYFDAYKLVVTTAFGAIKGAVTAGFSAIHSAVSAALATIKAVFTTVWNTFDGIVDTAVGAVLGVVRGIGGKITGALGNLGGLLYGAGKELMEGLARGIADRIKAVIGAVTSAVQKIKDLLPGSPVKTGPLTSWNNGGAGKRLMGLLQDGIETGSPGVAAALASALDVGLPSITGSRAGAVSAGSGGSSGPVAGATYNLVVNGADLSRDPGGSVLAGLRRMELLTP